MTAEQTAFFFEKVDELAQLLYFRQSHEEGKCPVITALRFSEKVTAVDWKAELCQGKWHFLSHDAKLVAGEYRDRTSISRKLYQAGKA